MKTTCKAVAAIVALVLPASACAPPASVLPHEDSAAGHRRRAAAEKQKAADYPEHTSPKADMYYGARRDERLRVAYAHLGAAQELEDDYAKRCTAHGFTSVPAWPAVAEVVDRRRGVEVRMVEVPGSPDTALDQLRCRRAAIARDGFVGYADDPLAMREVALEAGDDEGTILLTAASEGDELGDLRRRARITSNRR